ncbi:energy-coupling factor transport system ATP-binding protein [Halogranum amylolyticum]|uniref:Energy-coupling factor transport system ATP-binding protein n=1 Tax=Halogranum amylolyticum TaxID=660520 RepID=A0A1H8MU60_9EURY|nr:energy-coupling factor transporter ATPase [Halogranum amylolyticum]SEO20706.1 energy-coupling factor transport system ATP-binding protein [Halogranum amylolyticum]
MSLIELNDVTFQYGTQPDDEYAVKDVDLDIESGQFVGVTGQSEAGKATLCRLISGQIPHFYHGTRSGTVSVEGSSTDESSVGELAQKIGYVFENPYDQLTGATSTVLEEVAFGLETHGLSRDEMRDRARESLAAIGVEELAERNPMQLSGGQCQRVAIASVIAMQPDVMVLQQPTAQLDPEGTEEVFEVVGKMNDEGYTVVMVSQEMERLVPHLDRLVVMDDGRIEFDGPPDEALVRAAEEGLPVSVPDPVTVGHRLRDDGLVSREEPLPVTEAECLAELRRVVDRPSSPEAPPRSPAVDSPDNTLSNGAAEPTGEVVLDDLHHRYPSGVEALQGVSFSLTEGCICLIGQNGAGKSTLVKHLNGLLEPTDGSVSACGLDTTEHTTAELAHHVGLSFQNPDDQLFHSTVEGEIEYGPRNLDFDGDELDETTDRALSLLGLEERRQQNPYDFGQPWRKRVAVASVVAMDTPVVVLDEPTSGQDVPGYERLGTAVERLVDSGKLVVVITHDMDFVREHADRTVLLAQGRVIADGETRDVLGDTETLARSNVHPPTITRIGLELGLGPLLSVDELFETISSRIDDTSV